MMEVRPYTKYDYDEISSWYHSRNIPITEDYLPEHGFIISGVAAGFIYGTDSNFCIFESFIANSETHRDIYQEGLRLIVEEMIKKSKELGYKNAYGFATSQTMIKIGAEQGFKFVETCSTIIKDL